jgi:flagellar hook-basal body complex protein FliE
VAAIVPINISANIVAPQVASADSPFGAPAAGLGGPGLSGLGLNGLGSSDAGSGALAFQSVFADAVNSTVKNVEQFQANASASIGRFVSGEGEDLHQVALATQQADLAFNLFMQVRNKVISAYQEVMRLQV